MTIKTMKLYHIILNYIREEEEIRHNKKYSKRLLVFVNVCVSCPAYTTNLISQLNKSDAFRTLYKRGSSVFVIKPYYWDISDHI